MSARSELEAAAMARAGDRCEYCRMHQSLQGARFHLEHVVPRSRGGPTTLENLAWACPGCNLHKSDRTHAADPVDGAMVVLFHPRRDDWHAHFMWSGVEAVGKTATGRATIAALQFNHPRRLTIRQVESAFGLFPPEAVGDEELLP